MIGFLIDKTHFSFDNLTVLCTDSLSIELINRNDCKQCRGILSTMCIHNTYYCPVCINKWIDSGEYEGYSRSCWQHIIFVGFNEFFGIAKNCLRCYRKMTLDFVSRDLLPPAANLLLRSADSLNTNLQWKASFQR